MRVFNYHAPDRVQTKCIITQPNRDLRGGNQQRRMLIKLISRAFWSSVSVIVAGKSECISRIFNYREIQYKSIPLLFPYNNKQQKIITIGGSD